MADANKVELDAAVRANVELGGLGFVVPEVEDSARDESPVDKELRDGPIDDESQVKRRQGTARVLCRGRQLTRESVGEEDILVGPSPAGCASIDVDHRRLTDLCTDLDRSIIPVMIQ